MGYVAVSGGEQAIAASLELLERERVAGGRALDPELIIEAMPHAVEQVQSEGSVWAPEVAAVALKQASGSIEEAVFLVRAYRSTLERLYTSRVIDTGEMRVSRRISAAFKDIEGGQILGATRDYSHRLINFDLSEEESADVRAARVAIDERLDEVSRAFRAVAEAAPLDCVPKVCDYLRQIGMIRPRAVDDIEPIDITKTPLSTPAPRSVILQALSRGLTQAVVAIGYAAIRGFGISHPTVG